MARALLGKRPTMMVSTTPMLIQPISAKTSGRARRNVGRNSPRMARNETGEAIDHHHTNTNWNLVQFGTEKVAALKQWHWNFENTCLSRFELKFFPALRRRAIRSKLFSP